jgi:hypothetical protein
MKSYEIGHKFIPKEFLPLESTCNDEEDWGSVASDRIVEPAKIKFSVANYATDFLRNKAIVSTVEVDEAKKVLGDELAGDPIAVSFLMDAIVENNS